MISAAAILVLQLPTYTQSQSLKIGNWTSKDDFSDKLVQIGAGPPGGSYLPIASALCDELNEVRRVSLIRCVPNSSAGSVFNIHAVANGSLQLGLAQEDLVADFMKNAEGVVRGSELRTVALMHNSPIGVMVRKGSGITEIAQLQKGILNRGFKGSGIYANSQLVMNALQYEERDFKGITNLPPEEFEPAFCAGKIDVIINALAQPAEQFRRLRSCGGEFLSISPAVMEAMMRQNMHLRPMDIPAGLYGPEQASVSTLGVRNVLFTSSAVDDEAIYRVTVLLARGLDALRKRHPHLANLTALDLREADSPPAPLHRGSKRALNELRPGGSLWTNDF